MCVSAILIHAGLIVFQFHSSHGLHMKWKLLGFLAVEHVLIATRFFWNINQYTVLGGEGVFGPEWMFSFLLSSEVGPVVVASFRFL
jgi:hypothetical protein